MLKLIIAALLSLSSITAFADNHTKDAKKITQEEKVAKAKREIVKGANNVIPFSFEFTGYTVDALIEEINAAVKDGDHTIVIKFDSGGGSIFAGYKLIHRIIQLQSQGIKFVGVVDRLCASMCFMTYQFMDHRLAYPLAIIMDHPASGGPDHILKEISEILVANVHRQLKAAKISDITIKLYDALVLNDFYMNVKTAKDLGLIEMVILPGKEGLIKVRKEVKKPVKKSVKK